MSKLTDLKSKPFNVHSDALARQEPLRFSAEESAKRSRICNGASREPLVSDPPYRGQVPRPYTRG
ncbi:hypothetical protein [Comamonas serinivorans]|nr:hypothetical protein [Comamonas serinivorans]